VDAWPDVLPDRWPRQPFRPVPSGPPSSTDGSPLSSVAKGEAPVHQHRGFFRGQALRSRLGGVLLVLVPTGLDLAGRGRLAAHQVRGGLLGVRRSTRLNSSHVSRSYAVSCLKLKSEATRALMRDCSGGPIRW